MTSFAPGGPPRCFALVACAGVGQRAGATGPKQYAAVAGQAMVARTLAALAAVPRISATLVVLAPDDSVFEPLIGPQTAQRWLARCGGASRAQTVANGLAELAARGVQPHDWVLVHDAARCLLQPAWVERLIDACEHDEVGGLLALPLADTLKAEQDGRAHATVPRAQKWAAQTPQMFRLGLLQPALAAALNAGKEVTDEASAVEAAGHAPRLVRGDTRNLKITWPEDFELAEQLLAARPVAGALRIGEGWDTHALVPGRPLVLGGIAIPHGMGLLGHSDADALLHAAIDALLGAAGLGDIGRHFPDTDVAFRGADSAVLMAEAMRRVRAAGWQLVNLDATIVAQAPRLAPHIAAMRERMAQVLGVPADYINLKAKTAEKMGPVGEGRAIETRVVCLLRGA